MEVGAVVSESLESAGRITARAGAGTVATMRDAQVGMALQEAERAAVVKDATTATAPIGQDTPRQRADV